MNSRRETLIRLVVPRRDCPELLDFRKEVLHQVPPAVHGPVMLPWLRPGPPWGNHRVRAASLQIVEQPIRVECLVADEGHEREAVEKRRHPCEVVRLAGEDHEAHKVSERIHDRHDLARQAAPGTADPLPSDPSPCAGRLLVRLHHRAVDEHALKVELLG